MIIRFDNGDITNNLTSAVSMSGRNERIVQPSNFRTAGLPILNVVFSNLFSEHLAYRKLFDKGVNDSD